MELKSCIYRIRLPFNIANYALLLHLLAKETDYEEGKLAGLLSIVQICVNQLEGIKQIKRMPYKLPFIKTKNLNRYLNIIIKILN